MSTPTFPHTMSVPAPSASSPTELDPNPLLASSAAPNQNANTRTRGKHIVIFCDGSGQGGLTTSEHMSTQKIEDTQGQKRSTSEKKERYPTNVHRLSRCVPGVIEGNPPLQQVVFYQSGVGAGNDFDGGNNWPDWYEIMRGTSTASKIRDTYNFIAQNYVNGDKIFLFGFSRGA